MNTYDLGSPAVMTAAFVGTDGDPLDPGTVTVRVRKPDGTITAATSNDIDPVEGTATFPLSLDQTGFWFGRFEPSEPLAAPRELTLLVRQSAFDTDATDGGPYFGATIDGVTDKLPDRQFTDVTKPTEGAVGRFIMEIAERVSARIGAVDTITDTARRASVLGAARSLVHLGAASWAEAAGSPEEAEADNASTYASWLWAKFQEGLNELATTARGLIPPDTPDDPSIAAGSPVWSFPNTVAAGRATTSWESY